VVGLAGKKTMGSDASGTAVSRARPVFRRFSRPFPGFVLGLAALPLGLGLALVGGTSLADAFPAKFEADYASAGASTLRFSRYYDVGLSTSGSESGARWRHEYIRAVSGTSQRARVDRPDGKANNKSCRIRIPIY
jgi:hypothetical protein